MPKGAGEERAGDPLCDSGRARSGEGSEEDMGQAEAIGARQPPRERASPCGGASVRDERVVPRGEGGFGEPPLRQDSRTKKQPLRSGAAACGGEGPTSPPQGLGAEAGTRGQAA